VARKAYARRYAQAVFQIALEADELDRWQSDLDNIVELVSAPPLLALLESPKIKFDDKAKVLSELIENINPLVLNLVHLLVDKGRLDIISDLAEDYKQMGDSHRGIEQAEVTTAIPLDDEDKRKLAESLGTRVGKEVVLQTVVDPGVIGGIIARIGGKLLDGSTRSKLAALRKELAGAGRKR